jgi:hypothetical protein
MIVELVNVRIIINGSACSTSGVHSQTWSTSGIGLGSKSRDLEEIPARELAVQPSLRRADEYIYKRLSSV